MFERFHHAGNFFEMLDRSIFLMRQHPIVHIQHCRLFRVLFREVYVVADINVDAVVIDRIDDFPMKSFFFTGDIVIRLSSNGRWKQPSDYPAQ